MGSSSISSGYNVIVSILWFDMDCTILCGLLQLKSNVINIAQKKMFLALDTTLR